MRLVYAMFVVLFLVSCSSGSTKGTCTLSSSGTDKVYKNVTKTKCEEKARELARETGGLVFMRWDPD